MSADKIIIAAAVALTLYASGLADLMDTLGHTQLVVDGQAMHTAQARNELANLLAELKEMYRQPDEDVLKLPL